MCCHYYLLLHLCCHKCYLVPTCYHTLSYFIGNACAIVYVIGHSEQVEEETRGEQGMWFLAMSQVVINIPAVYQTILKQVETFHSSKENTTHFLTVLHGLATA